MFLDDDTMHPSNAHLIRAAEVVLPCDDLDETLAYFTERLGFRVEAIFPADDPAVAVIAAHGVRLRLQRGGQGAPGMLRLLLDEPALLAEGERVLTAPNGTRIELVPADPAIVLPPIQSSFVLSRMTDDAQWKVGRAGMRYRDLVPDRQGGHFIASHICIPGGGPVPDYVHFHKVRFQMIYCRKGWVRVVYEDQGAPFVMTAGDCVLQPPQIRHRVLESSPGLEVIEIGCPAEHETRADPDLALPTGALQPDRDFGGQRFVRHEAAKATWLPWRLEGYEYRDTGIGAATQGLAGVRTVRPRGHVRPVMCSHHGELLFLFALDGGVTLQVEGRGAERLAAGDSVVVPAGMPHALTEPSADLELLEVTLPAALDQTLKA
jgi:quercetin dioxygenase-like cupin family protein